MEAFLNNAMAYIVLYAPTVLAILGSISTIIVSIKKLGSIKTDTTSEVKKLIEMHRKTQEQIQEVVKENKELKASLIQKNLDEHKIYTKEHKRG